MHPGGVLDAAGALGPSSTAVHATHLTDADVALLGARRTTVAMCPTTERDLADGIGPARALAEAGAPLALGSDSHAVVDLLEEARAVELDERLRSQRRGHWTAAALLRAATADGHRCLGWPEAGVLRIGAPADFVAVALDSVRTAGVPAEAALEAAVFAATATDVRTVVVAGRTIVDEGVHRRIDDVPRALEAAVSAVLPAS
jgi:cytosine/adenosine deaminase-related metal-dependent hydrolase